MIRSLRLLVLTQPRRSLTLPFGIPIVLYSAPADIRGRYC